MQLIQDHEKKCIFLAGLDCCNKDKQPKSMLLLSFMGTEECLKTALKQNPKKVVLKSHKGASQDSAPLYVFPTMRDW